MEDSKIQWTDNTFSPWWGCTPRSPGCAHCYAADLSKRYGRAEYRRGAPRVKTKNWNDPVKWNRKAKADGKRIKVFPSMCDIFDTEVPDSWRMEFFDLVISTPNIDWLLLTKRPQDAQDFYLRVFLEDVKGRRLPQERWQEFIEAFIPNVWLGVSVENQEMADERIPILCDIPARKRFLSVEPMLERIDLVRPFGRFLDLRKDRLSPARISKYIHWIIFGGESGKNARPCHVDWVRDGVKQCLMQGVAPFVKQIGSNPAFEPVSFNGSVTSLTGYVTTGTGVNREIIGHKLILKDPKGGDISEFPLDLRVRKTPDAA